VLNCEVIARAEAHPLRLAILELMLTPPPDGDPAWSAKTVGQALDKSLARTSHHMREMRDRGWLVEVGTRRARGAVETFYRLSDNASLG
jgi:Helix-turn-helix domain